MLTCGQIITRLQALETSPIDTNYHFWASRIHPKVEWQSPYTNQQINASPTLSQAFATLKTLPEVIEAERALNYHTPDFTDMTLRLVTLWQANAAQIRWWIDNMIDDATEAPANPTYHPCGDEKDDAPSYTDIRRIEQVKRRRNRIWRIAAVDGATLWPGPAATPPATTQTGNYQVTLTYTAPDGKVIATFTVTHPEKFNPEHHYRQLIELTNNNLWMFTPRTPKPNPAAEPEPTEADLRKIPF